MKQSEKGYGIYIFDDLTEFHTMTDTTKYLESNKDKFLNELIELLKIPSVSTDPSFKDDILKAADFLKDKLIEAGADQVEVCETGGYPIVYGEKIRSEEHTSELQSRPHLVCRLLLEKKKMRT